MGLSVYDEIQQKYLLVKGTAMIDKWYDFFHSYTLIKQKDGKSVKEKPYIEQIRGMHTANQIIYDIANQDKDQRSLFATEIGCRIFQVDYNHLMYAYSDILGIYDEQDKQKMEEDVDLLFYQIKYDWKSAESAIKEAVYRTLKDISSYFAEELKDANGLSVHMIHFDESKIISNLSSRDLDKFCRIEGMIAQYDDQASMDPISSDYICKECDTHNPVSGRKKPKSCVNCDSKDFPDQPDSVVTEDFMYFRLQDLSENMREGRMIPAGLDISITGADFVKNVYAMIETGMRVAVNGILKLTEYDKYNSNVATIEFHCYGIELLKDTAQYSVEMKEKVALEITADKIDDHYEKLKRSICPHLEGLESQKEGLLLAMIGSPPLLSKDGSRTRGELNILLIGNPASGKTEMLRFVESVVPGSLVVQGSNASKVGLTASVNTTDIVRGGVERKVQRLDAGVYGLVRKGSFVCIDELDKVQSDEHYESISSAMDDFQIMRIDKARVHTQVKCNCGSIHAANPITNSGMWDVTQDIFKQTNFASWLMSRFDLKFLHLSHRDEASRHMFWKHKAMTHSTIMLEKDYLEERQRKGPRYKEETELADRNCYTREYLRHEIAYLRNTYHPVLKPGSMAWGVMQNFWNLYNSKSLIPKELAAQTEGKTLRMPLLDERSFNSLVRLSQAVARGYRNNEVNSMHMAIAISLMKRSIGMFIPRIDELNEEARAVASMTIALNEGLKIAIKQEHKDLALRIKKFAQGYFKTIHNMHGLLFNKCNQCQGTGYWREKKEQTAFMKEHIPCPTCNGMKGHYSHFTYQEFTDICQRSNTFVNVDQYWKILRDSKTIKKETEDEKIPDPRASMFIDYYLVIIDLKSNATRQAMEVINDLFGLQDDPRAPIITTTDLPQHLR